MPGGGKNFTRPGVVAEQALTVQRDPLPGVFTTMFSQPLQFTTAINFRFAGFSDARILSVVFANRPQLRHSFPLIRDQHCFACPDTLKQLRQSRAHFIDADFKHTRIIGHETAADNRYFPELNDCNRARSNSSPGFHFGVSLAFATFRPAQKARRVCCTMPLKSQFGLYSSEGW